MKQICTNYTFNVANAQITLVGVNVPLSQVLLIADATTGQILYDFANGTGPQSYSQGTNSVITLKSTANLAGASNTDNLTIYYDDGLSYSSVSAISYAPTTNDVAVTDKSSGSKGFTFINNTATTYSGPYYAVQVVGSGGASFATLAQDGSHGTINGDTITSYLFSQGTVIYGYFGSIKLQSGGPVIAYKVI